MGTVNLFGAAGGGRIHGEIVTWDMRPGTRVPFTVLKDALVAAGLNDKVARDMQPKNAFARAITDLTDRRIVRKVMESAGEIKMQFTAESRDSAADRLTYDYEAHLYLDKVTGQVRCPDAPELAAKAQALIDAETAVRTVSDINRIIQRLFELNADLFQIRDAGGVYFVPAAFGDFLDRIDQFLRAAGASLRRYPVPVGYAHGERSVCEAVSDGLERLVGLHVKAIEEFDDKARDSTLEKMVERINTTRFKAESYAEYLTEKRQEIEDSLAAARQTLRNKIAAMGRSVKVPEPDAAGDEAAAVPAELVA